MKRMTYRWCCSYDENCQITILKCYEIIWTYFFWIYESFWSKLIKQVWASKLPDIYIVWVYCCLLWWYLSILRTWSVDFQIHAWRASSDGNFLDFLASRWNTDADIRWGLNSIGLKFNFVRRREVLQRQTGGSMNIGVQFSILENIICVEVLDK